MNEEKLIKSFNLLVLDDDSKNTFIKYYKVRGYGIYKTIYDAILSINGNNSIEYKVFSDFIRYDKSIRDELYKYLAMYEQVLVNNICENYKYIGKCLIENSSIDCILKNNLIIADKSRYDMELFSNVRLTLGGLFILNNKLNSKQHLSKEQKNILDLRNMVMHHKFLLIDITKDITKENLEDRKKCITNLIKSFLDEIPKDYNDSLLEFFGKINTKTKSPITIDL